MLSFLAANPAKAAAWAQVQRIAPTEIPRYVAGLTAVMLTSEIAVTSYRYSAGQPIPVPMILPTGTALLINSSGQPRALCYCGNPLTADVTVTSFVAQCEKSLATGGWRQGQVDYPRELSVDIHKSAIYLAAVDIRTKPLPPDQLIPGPVPNGETVQVKCVLSARLVPPADQSIGIDQKDWVTREFTPTGIVNWSWTVNGLISGEHPLNLELQPAVATGASMLLQPSDNSPYTTSYVTQLHVRASAITHAGEWWNDNWPTTQKILTALGVAVLAFLAWILKLREWARDFRSQSNDKP
jgi:hypothetical protein